VTTVKILEVIVEICPWSFCYYTTAINCGWCHRTSSSTVKVKFTL